MGLNDTERARRGELIAEVLQLRRSKDHRDRYATTWGTKTALGIFNTVERLITEGK